MQDFVAIAVPKWVEGKDWVADGVPIASASSIGCAVSGPPRTKALVEHYQGDIIANSEKQ